jgi:CheY-like chemotaxis protein/tetratricopeptide (TPR) repeat protein
MNLKLQLPALQKQKGNLTLAERAELSCDLAKQFEKAGDYDSAYKALAEFWPEPNQPPNVQGLDESGAAAVLLRAGSVAGWLGGASQTEGAQETAKDLITQSIEIFDRLGHSKSSAEARGDLALCYWREGAYDESRIHLAKALSLLGQENVEAKAVLLIRAAIVEVDSKRFEVALNLYNQALPLVEQSQNHALQGSFHFEYGLLLRRLATPENREAYIDRALIEYAAASFHFEQVGNHRYLALVETNLGYLYFTLNQYREADAHLDRARHVFLRLRDVGTAAQVDETRARTLLAQGYITEAERVVRAAVRVLERGGQQAVLAEALATHGVALARLGNDLRSRSLFERSATVAETAGDLEGAGRAKLSIIEELGEKIAAVELVSIYRSAIDLLKNSQDPASTKRLISCAEIILNTLARLETQTPEAIEDSWEGFSLKRHVKAAESSVIERALRDAGGSVSKAAKLLGFKHHQSLISLLNSRHKDLLKTRSTVRKRRRHIVRAPGTRKAVAKRVIPVPKSEISILHVEDHDLVARTIGDIIAAENWQVDLCSDSDTALLKLTGNDRYDVLIFDNNLPGISGLELVARARKITNRRRTPIIVLSAEDCEQAAWRAGANAFLRKTQAMDQLATTIRRLVRDSKSATD